MRLHLHQNPVGLLHIGSSTTQLTFTMGTSIVRWRPDKAPRQCTMEQLGSEARPGRLIGKMMRG